MLDGDVWDEAGDCVSLTPTRANRSRCSAWFAGKCIASVDGVCEVGNLRSDHPFRGGRPGAQLPAFASVKASEACDAVTLCEFAEKYWLPEIKDTFAALRKFPRATGANAVRMQESRVCRLMVLSCRPGRRLRVHWLVAGRRAQIYDSSPAFARLCNSGRLGEARARSLTAAIQSSEWDLPGKPGWVRLAPLADRLLDTYTSLGRELKGRAKRGRSKGARAGCGGPRLRWVSCTLTNTN